MDDAFYNPLGISDTILDLLKSMKDFLQQLKNEINKIKLGLPVSPNDYRPCYSFEYLDNGYHLIFPYLYENIISNKKISNEENKN